MARTGTGRIYKRGAVWWVQFGFRGKTYRESSKSTKQDDARQLLRKRMEEMGAGTFSGLTEERVTFEDLAKAVETDYQIHELKSVRRLRLALVHLRRTFADALALDITDDRVNRYVLDRRDEGASDSSIQKELAALRRGFRLKKLRTRPDIPNLKAEKRNVRQGFVGYGDMERLAAELPEPLRPVAWFAFHTGWRKGEVLGLQWSRVDFERGIVRLDPDTTKNKDGRELPFRALPALAALLEERRKETRAREKKLGRLVPWVFHREGDPIRHMDGGWRSACVRAGVGGLLFHDLRRSAVRNMERAGVSRSIAMKVTGHKTESIYTRYAITDTVAMEEGIQKLAKLHEEAPEKATVKRISEVG